MNSKEQDSKRKKTIIVGITGKIDSIVAAYLLKKQGHDVKAVSLIFNPSEEDLKKVKVVKDDDDEGDEYEGPSPFLGVYLIEDVEKVKNICDQLDISFYAVNAQEIYEAKLTDYVVAARLGGYHFEPKVFCTNLMFEVLISKMSKLKADKVASGHYAKVIKNQTTHEYNVYVSNDLENDQSFLLSRLSQNTLSKIELPLSEVRRVEVEKISKMLNIELVEDEEEEKIELMEDPRLARFVEERASTALMHEGDVYVLNSDTVLGEHTGVHNFYLGTDNFPVKNTPITDKNIIVAELRNKSGLVRAITLEDIAPVTHLVISACVIDEMADVSRPFEGYAKFKFSKEKFQCLVTFKNNKKIYIELKVGLEKLLFSGDTVVVYTRMGVGGKVVASGLVSTAGHFDDEGTLRLLPKTDEEESEDEDEDTPIKDVNELKF